MNRYTLLISCSDKKGLVFGISQILLHFGVNIEKNDEFVDVENGKFFMRTQFAGVVDMGAIRQELNNILPPHSELRLIKKERKNIVILCTKEAHCLGDILIRHYSNELDTNILAVISNYDELKSLVERFDIPFHTVSHEGISREELESRVLDILAKYNFDFMILAKYMRILSPDFVRRYENKILNIHHSFLPAFIGANPYKQAYERGVKIIGATAHFVNDNLDEGPILAQDIAHIDHSYSWKDMQKRGRDIEKVVLARAIEIVLEDRVFIHGNKTVIF